MASINNIDILLCCTLIMMTLPLVLQPNVVASFQGAVSCCAGGWVALTAFVFLFQVLAKLFLMIALLLAVPFGTLVYLATYGDFATGKAAVILSLLMTLKIILAVALVTAHDHYFLNKKLLLLVGTSMAVMVLISFLHGVVPGILVSISDAVGAIIVSALMRF